MALHVFFDGLLILWVVWVGYWVASAVYERATAKTKETVRRARGFGFVFIILLLILLTPIGYEGPLGYVVLQTSAAVKAAGLATAAAGISLAIWARRRLGANWSRTPSVKKGHTLVTGGPYSIVRHPIYTGILFGVIGSVLVLWTVGSLVIVPLAVLVLRARMRQEEKLMQETFGDAYSDYRRRTKAIVPWLW